MSSADYIVVHGKKLEYSIIRKKRKTVGINISPEYGIRVSAPGWVTNRQIRRIVEEKAEWILKKIGLIADMQEKPKFTDGEFWYYLGKQCILRVSVDVSLKKPRVDYLEDEIRISLPYYTGDTEKEILVQSALIQWYRRQAEVFLIERLKMYSEKMAAMPARVSIRQQKSRWGSCSSKKNISLNWKLIMMPLEIIDYVMIHELAHLKELNHSKAFWEVVSKELPDYKERKNYLKQFSRKINI